MNPELLDFVGKTKTTKLMLDIEKIYREKFAKEQPQYFDKNFTKSFSIVSSEKEKEIKSIGMSLVDDLLTDNWGKGFGFIMSGDDDPKILVSTDGVNRNMYFTNVSDTLPYNVTTGGLLLGSAIQVGIGNATPQRTDFSLENLQQTQDTLNSGITAGVVKIPTQMISIFNGDISETGLCNYWRENPLAHLFLQSRDLINPIVPILIGETINVEYSMVFS